MPKRRTGSGKRRAAPVVRLAANPDRLLDDFEDAMLAGDRERMEVVTEQLWKARGQVTEALTERLIDGRARIPAIAFELLGSFAGQRAATHLRRIAANRDVADIVRLGAHRRAGWPERSEAKRRREFLATLHEPDQTLITAIDQARSFWPPEMEILEEVYGYLAVLPSNRRQAVVSRAVDQLGAATAWLLRALLHDDDPAVQRLALRELTRMREPGSAGSVGRLARTTGEDELRAEAIAAGQRLRLQVVDAEVADEADEPLPFPEVDRALLSMIDGSGGQVILVVRRWSTGLLSFVDIFHQDDWGIKGVFGASRTQEENAEGVIEGLEEAGIDLVEVDLATVRGTVDRALGVNAATGHRVPPAFELWEPLLHDTYPPADDEPLAAAELDDAPSAGRRDLVAKGGELAAHPWFESWGFDVPRTSAAMAHAPPPKGGRLTDRQYRPLIEQLVDPPTCAAFRRRLRRQAWLFEQDGERRERDVSLATAADLAAAGPADLAKQPFLRGLIEQSVRHVVGELFYGL